MSVHPNAIVEDGATLGAGCVIHAHAIVTRHCTLGEGVVVHPFAVLGGDPQDLSFDPATASGVRIGARTVLREHVTVNRATKAGAATELGADCFLMAASHVGHDCRVGDRAILANGVLLAGHVHVGERAFLGGGAAIHQFVRIGEGAMVGGLARITRDVPPFSMAAERDELVGLNVVGLRRRGLQAATLAEVKAAFRAACAPVGRPRELAAAALAGGGFASAEARRFLEFFAGGRRGFLRTRGAAPGQDADG
ncbi:MAG: acyl-ACP--UDP-N-acetylglucosamine O-acyltransferase [Proteobacteria bacterium]|nr:acyl-ACP--UDP-N-acetylglucosamine O-acyltransferase [Pseudomonadota bacterium]